MSPLRGILLKIFALALFTIMSSIIKEAMAQVPVGEVLFFRTACSLPVILVWLAVRKELTTGLRTRAPMLHLWRGMIGGTSMGLNFFALGILPLPEVTVIGFIAPILTLILAVFILGETVRLFRWSMVALGLVGVVIVVAPRIDFSGTDTERLAMLGIAAAFGTAALRALVQIHIRKMVKTETAPAIVFYFALTVSICSLATIPFGWVMPETGMLWLLVCAGVIGGVAQLFMTTAFRYADTSVLAPFDYVSILFSMFAGYVWFGDVPTFPMLIGAALVMLSGGLIVWRERQIGIRDRKDRISVTPQG